MRRCNLKGRGANVSINCMYLSPPCDKLRKIHFHPITHIAHPHSPDDVCLLLWRNAAADDCFAQLGQHQKLRREPVSVEKVSAVKQVNALYLQKPKRRVFQNTRYSKNSCFISETYLQRQRKMTTLTSNHLTITLSNLLFNTVFQRNSRL